MTLKSASLALAAGLALGAPAAAADPTPTVAAEHVAAPARPAASPEAGSRYAQREKQDNKAAEFQGGQLVVVGVSGAAVLVLIILLLLLI